LLAVAIASASAQEKPKIRTITAFIRLDPGQYQQQVADTLTMLRNAKARYELAGYEVETIRIATQPFRNTPAECRTKRRFRFSRILMPSQNRKMSLSVSVPRS